MSEEQDAGVTIKFGERFNAPWFTPRGTVSELRQQIAEAFGLRLDKDPGPGGVEVKTLAELMVEAGLIAQGLWETATKIGWSQATQHVDRDDDLAPGTTTADVRRSIEQKVAETDDTPDKTELKTLIAVAPSKDILYALRSSRMATGEWTAAHDTLAKQRVTELEGQQA